jgi:signal transduction histidine kinase
LLTRILRLRPAVILFAWLAALGVVAWLLYEAYAVALERGERATAALAAVVEQQTARTFQAIGLTLGAVGDAHQLKPRPRKNDREFQQMMMRRLADLPFVRALFIIAPDGWIIHDTDYPRTPEVSLADRAYFRAHSRDPAHAGTVWPPLESRGGTGWFVPVTRPLGRHGQFEGVVVAAIQADHFETQFRSIGLARGYLIALFYSDGTLIAQYPRGSAHTGQNLRHLAVFSRRPGESSGTFWTGASLVPGKHVVSYRLVEHFPLVLHVSRSKENVLVEWRRTAAASAVGMGALTALLAWFMARLVHDRARRARERERRAQAEKMEALGQLTAGIAHDFGNLLHLVAMNNHVMRQAPLDPVITKEALAATDRAVQSGQAMLERLMSSVRRRPVAVAPLRLDDWLERAQPLLKQAAGPLVTLRTQVSRPLPDIVCDAAQLDAALVNLIVNARDAMAGSGSIRVHAYPCDNDSGAPRAFVRKPAAFVCLSVEDDGPGMTERIKRRALEPFYTTKGDAGTGLGLSQVYGFMQQVGGDMTIDSAPGKGTRVHLFFRVP